MAEIRDLYMAKNLELDLMSGKIHGVTFQDLKQVNRSIIFTYSKGCNTFKIQIGENVIDFEYLNWSKMLFDFCYLANQKMYSIQTNPLMA